MDSVTQATLGAAVGVAVMGRRTSLWKSALVGAVCGTLPDLDSLIDYGDPIRNMTQHRGFSHSLFYLTLLAPYLAGIVVLVLDRVARFRRWWLALWLVLLTHALLDAMTVYGTQLALPFTNYPYGLGSIFIIDPLYTLPLLGGLVLTLMSGRAFWNSTGLVLSGLYLIWSFAAQQYVETIADQALADQDRPVERRLVTPAPVTTLVWRVVAVTPDGFLEGYYSLNDRDRNIRFQHFPRGGELYEELEDNPGVKRLARFSKGLFKLQEREGQVLVTDLRMGQEPNYAFNFVVAERRGDVLEPTQPRLIMEQPDILPLLEWLWYRARGEHPAMPWANEGQ